MAYRDYTANDAASGDTTLDAHTKQNTRFSDVQGWFPDEASAAEFQAMLLNTAKTGFDFTHIMRSGFAFNTAADGTANQALLTDGAGAGTFGTVARTGFDFLVSSDGTSGQFLKTNADGTGEFATIIADLAWENKATDFTAVASGRYLLTAGLDITLIDTPSLGDEFYVMAGDGFDISATNIDILQAASGEKIDGVDANSSLTHQVLYRFVYTADVTTGWRVLRSAVAKSVTYKDASFTATANNLVPTRYMINTSGNAVTATLPASPIQGDEVELIDFANSFATNNLTINRNGNKIQGFADNVVVTTNNDNVLLQYQTNTGTTLTNDKYLAVGGTNEYVDCGNDSSLQITGAITVSAWVNAASGPGILLGKYDTTGNQRSWYIGANTNKFLVVLCDDGTAATKNYHTSVAAYDSTWHHVCFTYDGNDVLKLYVDGVEDTSVTKTADTAMTTLHNSTSNFGLGASNGTNPASYYTGSLDEIGIWNAALSASQVAQLYMGGAPIDLTIHPASGNLQAWYRCGDGDTYPTLTDNSTNSNAGTMTNMESGDLSSGAETGGTINDDTWVFIGNN